MFSVLLAVTASMWLRVTPADSLREGYRVIEAEGKVRSIAPITEYSAPAEENHYNKLHHHGFALENPWACYRVYFDKKQTVDVYVKQRPGIELPTSYWYPTFDQIAAGYGDDVLRVSGTVGCGSLKPWNGKKMVHFEDTGTRSQRIVEVSAEKAVAEMAQNGVTTRYTVYGDRREMRVDVEGEYSMPLCTGVQHVPAKADGADTQVWTERTKDGGALMVSWGTDWPVNDTIHYHKQTVGMAVYVPGEYVVETVRDAHNELCILKPGAHYYTLVVSPSMEKKCPVKNCDRFSRYLHRWVRKVEKR